ncbi:hypothetical protein GCM10007100_26540 [Roseibacillus persicicus]|uniref:OmpH family outer membrane protein n=1 Tax=Roseibacillus persicicus TaxID=454148 RepID=A0A918TR22_9BACT|nr:hypothetical protein GCM10007100_26540 [Roseibacillus persicicus]
MVEVFIDDRRAGSFRLRWRGGNFQLRLVNFRLFACLALSTVCLYTATAQEGVTAAELPAVEEKFKVATVDIQSLFKSHPKTLSAEREIDLARAEIQKTSQLANNEIQEKKRVVDRRVLEIREGHATETEIAQAQRELPVLVRELQLAENEKLAERNSANQRLNEQMLRRMEGILAEIVEFVAKKGEAEGFDMVIDISGDNSSQVAPILFCRDAVDVTEMMRKELSKSTASKR